MAYFQRSVHKEIDSEWSCHTEMSLQSFVDIRLYYDKHIHVSYIGYIGYVGYIALHLGLYYHV